MPLMKLKCTQDCCNNLKSDLETFSKTRWMKGLRRNKHAYKMVKKSHFKGLNSPHTWTSVLHQ